MSRSGYRKLILMGLIAALGCWYGVTTWLPGGGPVVASAVTGDASGLEEILGASLGLAELPAPVAAELSALERRAWPPNPFFRDVVTGDAEEPMGEDDAAERVVLSGVIGGQTPLALINGMVVSVGDRLADGSVVITIDEYSVELDGPGGSRLLSIEK